MYIPSFHDDFFFVITPQAVPKKGNINHAKHATRVVCLRLTAVLIKRSKIEYHRRPDAKMRSEERTGGESQRVALTIHSRCESRPPAVRCLLPLCRSLPRPSFGALSDVAWGCHTIRHVEVYVKRVTSVRFISSVCSACLPTETHST